MSKILLSLVLISLFWNCQKGKAVVNTPVGSPFNYSTLQVNGSFSGFEYKGINATPLIKVKFVVPLDQTAAKSAIQLTDKSAMSIALNLFFEAKDSTVLISPVSPLNYLSAYTLDFSTKLKSKSGGFLIIPMSVKLKTAIDSTNKFPDITTEALLTLVQRQTFKYFWDFGHPISGMARERNTSGDLVTSGGSGFGLMAIPVAIQRSFISRTDGLIRSQKVVDFLKNKAQHFHGAYPHWINGATGAVIPFSANDDGADLIETSYLMMGLLTLRQYFDGSSSDEITLRTDITQLYDAVEWDFFTREGANRLYWHWSPTKNWAMNMPIQGWNEGLIAYVLAASSNTHKITKSVYDNGFARNGAMKNNSAYFGYQLPLGEAFGGPLFFEQYTFLGINPHGLTDAYADYWTQVVNHTKINLAYCTLNSRKYYGYSSRCWGLTASDIPNGYTASSPTNDVGVIAPTAAISSMPYTPAESIDAMRFFYCQLGDKIWGQYGFTDAFNLDMPWFADSFLAIDQGPQIGMIENYRTGLLWHLFMSCPEIKTGMTMLGFQSPNL